MTTGEIVEKMKQGWELRNFGQGWYLATPLRLYKHQDSIWIPPEMVDEMEAEEIIKVEIPYRSAIATLL